MLEENEQDVSKVENKDVQDVNDADNEVKDDAIKDPKVKQNLDKAYKENDALKKQVDELQAKFNEITTQNEKYKNDLVKVEAEALKASGKNHEALELEHKALQEKYNDVSSRLTTYSRDYVIDSAINLHEVNFASPKARQFAQETISKDLEYIEDKRTWVSKSLKDDNGNSKQIADAVDNFIKDEDNSYLFVQKKAKGTGAPVPTTTPQVNGAQTSDSKPVNYASLGTAGEIMTQLKKDGKVPANTPEPDLHRPVLADR